jgi:hypothetical protein
LLYRKLANVAAKAGQEDIRSSAGYWVYGSRRNE